MLSWRYAGHPSAGGAEVVTHEVLRRMVRDGAEVTAFTASHPGAPMHDVIDGVRVVRRGLQWTVHVQAWRWLRRRLADFDVVVDQTNTIPFMTPLYVPRDKRRLFIHQLAREYWWRETRGAFKLVAPVGYALEPLQFRLYRRTRTLTVSDSTRRDLIACGVDGSCITIIPEAVNVPPVAGLGPRTGPLRLIVIGRLTPAKFIDEAVEVFAAVQARVPDAVLDIVGAGDDVYRARLEGQVRRLGLRGVTFHGRVDEAEKLRLLETAHVHVFTSHREGWGLTVSEAAMRGTPSVGYAVPGVRDSIADRRLLADSISPDVLAQRVLALHGDPALYDEVRAQAWERARTMSWERTAQAFAEAVR